MNKREDKTVNNIVKTMPWGKWLIIFASLILCVGMGTTQAFAITSTGNNFTMINAGTDNSITGGMNNVIFTWDGTQRQSVAKANQVSNVSFSSTCSFFGFTWATHDNVLYGPGTYTVYTACPAGSPGCGLVKPGFPPLTFTVGPDELGVHYQFNWSVTGDIDMINVFKRHGAAFSPSPMCTLAIANGCGGFTDTCGPSPDLTRDKLWDLMSKDVDGDGVSGLPFVDGPFIGFSGNMNVMVPGGIPAHLLPKQCEVNTCSNTNTCTVSDTMTFGLLLSELTLTIENNGDPGNNLVLNAVSSPTSALFSIVAEDCSNATLVSNQTTTTARQSCTVKIQFNSPGTRGNYTGSFQLQSNDLANNGITRINLIGGNSPPDKPELVSPENGLSGVGAEQEFRWMITTDPGGNPIKYQVFVCTNLASPDCIPAAVVGRNSKGMFYAGGAGLFMIGMTFIGGMTGRKRIVLLLVIVVLFAGGALISCHSKDVSGTTPLPAGQVSYFATGLSAGTTYYWKVVADNGQPTNNTNASCIWTFTTK